MARDALTSNGRPLRVGLFGFYGYGNFGDDVMALMFARLLKERGTQALSICTTALSEFPASSL